jgi:hypothetical protein
MNTIIHKSLWGDDVGKKIVSDTAVGGSLGWTSVHLVQRYLHQRPVQIINGGLAARFAYLIGISVPPEMPFVRTLNRKSH